MIVLVDTLKKKYSETERSGVCTVQPLRSNREMIRTRRAKRSLKIKIKSERIMPLRIFCLADGRAIVPGGHTAALKENPHTELREGTQSNLGTALKERLQQTAPSKVWDLREIPDHIIGHCSGFFFWSRATNSGLCWLKRSLLFLFAKVNGV